jgi:antirestriction protein
LGCYNGGRLVGDWFDAVDAPQDMDAFNDVIDTAPGSIDDGTRRLHVAEGHEELWCMDHENFAGMLDGECSPVEAARIAVMIGEIRDAGFEPEAVAAWADNVHGTLSSVGAWSDIQSDFEESYAGEHLSEVDYAQELAYEMGAVPEKYSWPQSYIDWESATRDLFSGDYFAAPAPGGRVYVFRSI